MKKQNWVQSGTAVYFGDGGIDLSGAPYPTERAKFIAAAPLLLEELELARAEIRILLIDTGVIFPDQQETLCRIDAAIAAAKGEV